MSVLSKLQYSYHSALQSILLYIHFAIALKHFEVLYSWKFVSGHIASNNETVSRQNI